MTTEKIIIDGIHYIKETSDSGGIHIYPDPDFQPVFPDPISPDLPQLNTVGQKLDFVINELHLKKRFKP